MIYNIVSPESFAKKSLDLFFSNGYHDHDLREIFMVAKKYVFFTLPFAHFRVDTRVIPYP